MSRAAAERGSNGLSRRRSTDTACAATADRAGRERLPADLHAQRLATPVGPTDLHVTGDGRVETIEAKRSSEHAFVRQALGQLLDHAVHSPEPAIDPTALLPDRPKDRDLHLLHTYGIDCTFLDGETFRTEKASDEPRARSRAIWGG